MNRNNFKIWFSIVSTILILFGLTYMFFGLDILPVRREVLLDWETALYGAIMTGWGVTLLLVGRIAFREESSELKRALFIGIAIWLLFEAFFSAKLGVWFNVAVDLGVLILFGIPLIRSKSK